MKQHYSTGTKVDDFNIIQYAKGIKKGGGDRIWNTEQLLKRLDKAGVRYTVKNNKRGRVISVDKNAYNNNSDIKRYYDDRTRLYNDSIEVSNTKKVFNKTSRKAINMLLDEDFRVTKKFPKGVGKGVKPYTESDITHKPTSKPDIIVGPTTGFVEESGSLPGRAKFIESGGLELNKIPQKIVELNKSTGNDVAANKYYQKYKKLVKDNITQGRKLDFYRDDDSAGYNKIRGNWQAVIHDSYGNTAYRGRTQIRFPAGNGRLPKPKDSFKLVDFDDKTQTNTNNLSNQTIEDNNKQEPYVSDIRNEVAAQKTFSKPKEEESKAPKFTSIGRSSMGNMLELYNEKGNMVESMSPTAKNVRKVMKHLGVGDENSSDDDVKTWFKDFSKQTDKGKRITFNTTSKKK